MTQAVEHALQGLSEKDFRQMVRDAAKVLGWWPYFTWTSIHSPRGLPDLILVKPGRGVVWAELKTEKGKVSPHQEDVMATLRAAGQEVYLWRPSDWPKVEAVLQSKVRCM